MCLETVTALEVKSVNQCLFKCHLERLISPCITVLSISRPHLPTVWNRFLILSSYENEKSATFQPLDKAKKKVLQQDFS